MRIRAKVPRIGSLLDVSWMVMAVFVSVIVLLLLLVIGRIVPQNTYGSPNLQHLRKWPYLEIVITDVIS